MEKIKELNELLETVKKVMDTYGMNSEEARQYVTGYLKSNVPVYAYSGDTVKEALLKDEWGVPIGAVVINQDTVKIQFSIDRLPKKNIYCSDVCESEGNEESK